VAILYATNDLVDFAMDAAVDTTAARRRTTFVDSAIIVGSGKGSSTRGAFNYIPQAAGDVVWVHFQGYFQANNDAGTTGKVFFNLYDTANAKILDFSQNIGVPTLNVYGTSTVTDATSSGIVRNALAEYDVKIDITAPNIVVEIYQDTVLWATATATNNGKLKPALIVWETWGISSVSVVDLVVSEVILADEDTRGMGLSALAPNGAGNYSQWIGDHTETSSDDMATVVSSGATAEKLSSTLSTFGGPASTALRALVVVTNSSARGGVVGDIRNFVRIASTDYNGSALGVTPGLERYTAVWDTNPNTAVLWDTTDFSSTEIGIESLV
jgi:hypothetical protein